MKLRRKKKSADVNEESRLNIHISPNPVTGKTATITLEYFGNRLVGNSSLIAQDHKWMLV